MPAKPGNAPSERIMEILADVEELEHFANACVRALSGEAIDVPPFPRMQAVVEERVRQKFTRKHVTNMRARMRMTRLAGHEYNIPNAGSMRQVRNVAMNQPNVTFKEEPLTRDEVEATVRVSNREAGMQSRNESIRKAQEKFSADPMASKLAEDKSKFTIGE